MNRWLHVQRADIPDQINWENLAYSPLNRNIRFGFLYLISFILLVIAFVGMVQTTQRA